jgi:hypothetical protein
MKRLPRSYTNQEFEEFPFHQDRTILCRVTLVDAELSKFYLNGILYHLQDTVELYEAITYQPHPYCCRPE